MSRRMSFSVLTLAALLVLAVVAVRDRGDDEREPAVASGTVREGDPRGASDELVATPPAEEDARAFSPAERGGDARLPASSGIESFVELRGVPRVAGIQADLTDFASESRDPAWATALEARLQSALSATTATLSGSYVECRLSRCIVALVRPAGSYDQKQPVGLPNRNLTRAVSEIGRGLDLLGARASQVLARDGALVHWQTLHRRCGPEWKCLERELVAR